jgi:hypothetical protein
MPYKKALMASEGLRDDDGCIHATSRKALKTRLLQKQTTSMHAIPSIRSNGVVLEAGLPELPATQALRLWRYPLEKY